MVSSVNGVPNSGVVAIAKKQEATGDKLLGLSFGQGSAEKTGPHSLKFSGYGYNDGMVLFDAKPGKDLKGALTYKVAGAGDYKILFLERSGEFPEDIIKEYRFSAEEKGRSFKFNIPKGTTKINVMAGGRLDIDSGDRVNLAFSDISIKPCPTEDKAMVQEMLRFNDNGVLSIVSLTEPTVITLSTGETITVSDSIVINEKGQITSFK
jgi:hypothetical protein